MKNIGLYFVFLLTTIPSCIQSIEKEEKMFTINKDTHSKLSLPVFINKPILFSATVSFDSSAIYKIDKDQWDWNKLFGFAYTELNQTNFVHINSVRWGWRYSNGIEFTSYCYDNKMILKDKFVIKRRLFEKVKLEIRVDYRLKEYQFYVDGVKVFVEKFTHNRKLTLIELPYFGGNVKAQKDIIIKFTDILVK